MVVGLAYFLARPSWRKTVVLLMAFVGMIPFVLSRGPHTGRVVGAVAPLLLLGGWGLNYFWELFNREMRGRVVQTVVFILVLGFGVCDAKWSFDLCRKWMNFRSNDNTIGQQVDKDWKQYRVIIAQHLPNFVSEAFTVLCDQKEAYLLNDSSPIYLEPGEKGKDIVLLVYGDDHALEEKVKREFPKAQWSFIPNPNGPQFMARILIPLDSLAERPGKILYVQRVSHDYWRRRFFCKEYGVARGLVFRDERVSSLTAPLPKELTVWDTGQAD